MWLYAAAVTNTALTTHRTPIFQFFFAHTHHRIWMMSLKRDPTDDAVASVATLPEGAAAWPGRDPALPEGIIAVWDAPQKKRAPGVEDRSDVLMIVIANGWVNSKFTLNRCRNSGSGPANAIRAWELPRLKHFDNQRWHGQHLGTPPLEETFGNGCRYVQLYPEGTSLSNAREPYKTMINGASVISPRWVLMIVLGQALQLAGHEDLLPAMECEVVVISISEALWKRSRKNWLTIDFGLEVNFLHKNLRYNRKTGTCWASGPLWRPQGEREHRGRHVRVKFEGKVDGKLCIRGVKTTLPGNNHRSPTTEVATTPFNDGVGGLYAHDVNNCLRLYNADVFVLPYGFWQLTRRNDDGSGQQEWLPYKRQMNLLGKDAAAVLEDIKILRGLGLDGLPLNHLLTLHGKNMWDDDTYLEPPAVRAGILVELTTADTIADPLNRCTYLLVVSIDTCKERGVYWATAAASSNSVPEPIAAQEEDSPIALQKTKKRKKP